jgi:hypothetical protein
MGTASTSIVLYEKPATEFILLLLNGGYCISWLCCIPPQAALDLLLVELGVIVPEFAKYATAQ